MFEVNMQLVNEAHRQNIVREFRHEPNIREANLARQDAKRERKYVLRLWKKQTSQSR